MTTEPPVFRAFWCVEFRHPTYGWCRVGYPMHSAALAQAEITYRLCNVKPKQRDQAARAYRMVKYVPESADDRATT